MISPTPSGTFLYTPNMQSTTDRPKSINSGTFMTPPQVHGFISTQNLLQNSTPTAKLGQFMFSPPLTMPNLTPMATPASNQPTRTIYMTYPQYLQYVANTMPVQQQTYIETPTTTPTLPTPTAESWDQEPYTHPKYKRIRPYCKQNTVRNVVAYIKEELDEHELLQENLVTEINVQYFHCNKIELLTLLPEIISEICTHENHYGIKKMNVRPTKRNSFSLKGVMMLFRIENLDALKVLFSTYPEFENLKWKKVTGMKQNY